MKAANVEIARDFQPGSAPFSSKPSSIPISKSGQVQDRLNILPPTLSSGTYSSLNMSHMHLFHHFSTLTSGTLILGPQLWKEKAVPTAFKVTHLLLTLITVSGLMIVQYEYLMHSMLFMAASHLRHLQPEEGIYRKEELEHFSQVIPAFNAALSGPITENNLYALCACSLLILQYSWACPDLTGREANNAIDFGFGSLLGLYSGMRRLALSLLTIHDPYLHSIMLRRPIEIISRYSENTNIPAELEDFFSHCCLCAEWCGPGDKHFSIRMEAASRLIPVLSALKLGEGELEASGLMSDISRYLFVLPLLSSEEYAQLLRNNDEASLVILLYYFSLVRRLLSGKYWWMRERSAHLCEWLLVRLGNRCERCVGLAREINSMQPLQ
jgi:hypothetical protein